jgi:hypothetical protein
VHRFTAVVLGWSYQHLALGDLKDLAEGRNIALTNAFANALWPNFANLVDDSAGATAEACARALRKSTSRTWSRST